MKHEIKQPEVRLDLKATTGFAKITYMITAEDIAGVGGFDELLIELKKGVIVSGSQARLVDWNYKSNVDAIKKVRWGLPINCLTRACGLRAKVCELIISNNYGDDIPAELLNEDEL